MSAEHTPVCRLPYLLPSQAQKHVTHNEALAMLDVLVQMSVMDRDLTAPPGTPADGDRYIVASSPTGDWVGQAGKVAFFRDGEWEFMSASSGWTAWVVDEAMLVFWNGSAWVDFASVISVLQNLSLLGIGTTADATNPFSAKLNKALWTARTVAEGGDGDLRYTLNKEAANDVLSLLMQRGFSGRAEIGLIGGDDLTIKVSPDGSSWTTALVIDRTSGLASVHGDPTAALGVATKQYAVARTGDAMSGPLSVSATAEPLVVDGENSVGGIATFTRYVASASSAVWAMRKARGSKTAPGAILSGDGIFGFRAHGWHSGGAFNASSSGAAFLCNVTEDWTATANGCRMTFSTTANGSAALTERLRIADAGDLQMGGANTVIDVNRHLALRSYTVGTLPSASTSARLIYVSDGTVNKRLAVCDGASWRFPDGNVVS